MKRPQRDLQKKRDDDERLMRAWNKWHREQLDEALAGAQGALIAELMTLLDQLELNSAKALLDRVERADWTSVDYDTRLTALHQVNAAITKLRERNGMRESRTPCLGSPTTSFGESSACFSPRRPERIPVQTK